MPPRESAFALDKTLRAAQVAARRRSQSNFLQALGITASVAAGLALLAVLLAKWFWQELSNPWLFGTLGAGALAAAALCAYRSAWSRDRAARELDQRLNLQSTLGSAIELDAAARPEERPFISQLISRSESLAQTADIRKAVPITFGRAWYAWPALASLALAAAYFLPERSQLARLEAQKRQQESRDAASEIRSIAESVKPKSDQAKPNEPIPTDGLDQSLSAIERELSEGKLSAHDARLRAAEELNKKSAEIEQRAAQSERDVEDARRALARAASRSLNNSPVKPDANRIAQALRKGDLDAAASALEELAQRENQLSPSERSASANELQKLADALEQMEQSGTNKPSEPSEPTPDSARDSDDQPQSLEDAARQASEELRHEPSGTDQPREPNPNDATQNRDAAEQPPKASQNDSKSSDKEQSPKHPDQTKQDQQKPEQQKQDQQKQSNDAKDTPGQQGDDKKPGANEKNSTPQNQPGEKSSDKSQQKQGSQKPDSSKSDTKPSEKPSDKPDAGNSSRPQERGTPQNVPQSTPEGTPDKKSGNEKQQPGEQQNQPKPDNAGKQSDSGTPKETPASQPKPGDQSQPQPEQKPGNEPSSSPDRRQTSEGKRDTTNSGGTAQQNPSTTGSAKNSPTPRPGQSPRNKVDQLAKDLRNLTKKQSDAQRDQETARGMRDRAEQMLDNASPEDRARIQELAKRLNRPDAPPAADAYPEWRGPTQTFDARPTDSAAPDAQPQERTIAEWLSEPRPGGKGQAGVIPSEPLRRAGESAQRAIEQQTIPPRHADLVRRVFKLNPDQAPAPGERK